MVMMMVIDGGDGGIDDADGDCDNDTGSDGVGD